MLAFAERGLDLEPRICISDCVHIDIFRNVVIFAPICKMDAYIRSLQTQRHALMQLSGRSIVRYASRWRPWTSGIVNCPPRDSLPGANASKSLHSLADGGLLVDELVALQHQQLSGYVPSEGTWNWTGLDWTATATCNCNWTWTWTWTDSKSTAARQTLANPLLLRSIAPPAHDINTRLRLLHQLDLSTVSQRRHLRLRSLSRAIPRSHPTLTLTRARDTDREIEAIARPISHLRPFAISTSTNRNCIAQRLPSSALLPLASGMSYRPQ